MATPARMKLLVKIDRIAAWTLLISFILFYFTGYGMLKHLMDLELARRIHDDILPVPILIAFVYHASFAVHLSLKRWRIWSKTALIVLLLISASTLTGFTLVHFDILKGTPKPQTIELD